MMSARRRVTAGGGTCCMPSALRKMEKTTANFTNELDIMSRNGSSDRRASISTAASGVPPNDVPAGGSGGRGGGGRGRRLGNAINKPLTDDDFLKAVEAAFSHGSTFGAGEDP